MAIPCPGPLASMQVGSAQLLALAELIRKQVGSGIVSVHITCLWLVEGGEGNGQCRQ